MQHVAATDDGRVPDLDAGDVGDRIERPDSQDADFQPQAGGSGAGNGSVFCATAAAVTSMTTMAARIFLVIAEPDYICGSWPGHVCSMPLLAPRAGRTAS